MRHDRITVAESQTLFSCRALSPKPCCKQIGCLFARPLHNNRSGHHVKSNIHNFKLSNKLPFMILDPPEQFPAETWVFCRKRTLPAEQCTSFRKMRLGNSRKLQEGFRAPESRALPNFHKRFRARKQDLVKKGVRVSATLTFTGTESCQSSLEEVMKPHHFRIIHGELEQLA